MQTRDPLRYNGFMKDTVKEIVRILAAENVPMPVQELAERTGFTPRYIRQILKESASENKAEGFSLESSFRKDVRLVIHDSSAFSAALTSSDASEEMKKEVLYDLLNRNDAHRGPCGQILCFSYGNGQADQSSQRESG